MIRTGEDVKVTLVYSGRIWLPPPLESDSTTGVNLPAIDILNIWRSIFLRNATQLVQALYKTSGDPVSSLTLRV